MNSDHSTLTAIIITFNEEDNILGALETISFADEVIVVDSYSTDSTMKKIKSFPNVKSFQYNFVDFASQRNLALKHATKDWVLFVDADERITEHLKKEIQTVIQRNDKVVGFRIPRKFVINKKVMNYSGLQTDRVLRLFKNGYGEYNPTKLVHETLEIKGMVKTLKNHIMHYTFKNYDSYKLKAEHYGQLKALELYKKGKRVSLFDLYGKPLYKFCYNYFFRLGFLDGKAGYTICRLNAYGVKYRYKELKRLNLSSPK